MLIDKNLILLDEEYESKQEIIQKNAELLNTLGRLHDLEGYVKAVNERESEVSTNMGDGIGMPHARTDTVKEASLIFLRLKKPIIWDDENPVDLVFQIAVPTHSGDLHLKILATLARKLIYDDFKETIRNVKDKDELLAILSEATGGLI